MGNIKDFGKRAGNALMVGIQINIALLVLPLILFGLYSVGFGGLWLAGGVMIIFAIAAIETFPVPFMRVRVVAKSMVAGALIALVFILIDMNNQADKQQEQELANLKIFSPKIYLDELKALGRNDEWFAALKDIRPAEYMAEKARRDEKAKRDQARKEKQKRREQIEQFYRNAKGEGRKGINLRAADFKDTWNLSVSKGRLHCKQGPVYNGQPRPYVLFDANGKTYGVNGAAMGKGGYADARTLLAGEAGEVPYDLKMLDVLLKSGLEMCHATVRETCGERDMAVARAQMFVEQRLKSPSSAEFNMNAAKAGMTECGKWVVASYVDAQNSFGVMIRTNYAVRIRKISKNEWVADEVVLAE